MGRREAAKRRPPQGPHPVRSRMLVTALSAPSSSLLAVALALFSAPPVPAAKPEGTTIAERYLPGESSTWRFEADGTPIGTCTSRYTGEVDLGGLRAHRFRSHVLLESPVQGTTLVQRFEGELWTNATGHPLRFELVADVAGSVSTVSLVFGRDGAASTAVVRQGGFEESKDLDVASGAYLLANNFIGHLELVLALDPPEERETRALFSANALRGLPFVIMPEASGDAGGAVYRDSLGEVLHLDAHGRLELVEIPAAKLRIERVEQEPEPFTIDVPPLRDLPDFDRDEVVVQSGDVRLTGTVTRPKGATGRLPAVFFVSGSGSQDRNGVSGGIDLGTWEILDRLTAEGFCVLRVDDRGSGGSSSGSPGATFEDLVADARACVRFLAAREDVDPERVFVIGHSEGGQTAPILAGTGEPLRGIVLMAAPGRSVDVLIEEQLAYGKELEGVGGDELASYRAEVATFLDRVREGSALDEDDVPSELQSFLGALPWLRSHMREDPLARLRRVECSVLILQGGRDIQVSAERDAAALQDALAEAEHPDFELVVFDDLDHLFKRTTSERPSGLEYLRDRPIDGAFLDRLVAWMRARL